MIQYTMSLTPITATITATDSAISVSAYNDTHISFSAFVTTTEVPIVEACRHILKTVGLVNGTYAARPYPMNILAGTKTVFHIPSLWFGSRQTMSDTHSDLEIIRNISYTGQPF